MTANSPIIRQRIRVMEALQLPEVLDGSKWIALSLPGGRVLPSQTLGVDAVRGKMYWCDGIYEPRAMCSSHFGTEILHAG